MKKRTDIKSPEHFLRAAFGEDEIAKENSKYPKSTQRPFIYRAMRAYAKEHAAKAAEDVGIAYTEKHLKSIGKL